MRDPKRVEAGVGQSGAEHPVLLDASASPPQMTASSHDEGKYEAFKTQENLQTISELGCSWWQFTDDMESMGPGASWELWLEITRKFQPRPRPVSV